MRTIRIDHTRAISPRDARLEWGSSGWAADSCLMEWSQLEREWLEPTRPAPLPAPAWRWNPSGLLPMQGWLCLVALALSAALLVLG